MSAGRFSDRKITKDSVIYDLLEPSDSIMGGHNFALGDDPQ